MPVPAVVLRGLRMAVGAAGGFLYGEVSANWNEGAARRILVDALDKAAACRQDICLRGTGLNVERVRGQGTMIYNTKLGGTDVMKIYNVKAAGQSLTFVFLQSDPHKLLFHVVDDASNKVTTQGMMKPTEAVQELIKGGIMVDPKAEEKAFRM